MAALAEAEPVAQNVPVQSRTLDFWERRKFSRFLDQRDLKLVVDAGGTESAQFSLILRDEFHWTWSSLFESFYITKHINEGQLSANLQWFFTFL